MNRSIMLNKHFQSFLLIIFIILFDRFTKYWVISYFNADSSDIIYLAPFLNIDLIWNKGIAFGLFFFEEKKYYLLITIFILVIILILIWWMSNTFGVENFSISMIIGGAIGNVVDRIYYSAVPDFIDFHINNFHWFVFNMADIFITIGIVLMILSEFKKND